MARPSDGNTREDSPVDTDAHRAGHDGRALGEREDSDSDDDHVEGEDNAFFLHDIAEQGAVEQLRELLPVNNGGREHSSLMRVMAAETCLLEKDDMGCLPVHVAIIYQRLECAVHMLQYSDALTAAMVRMKCADLNTPFVHLILRVGGINPQFSMDLISEIFGVGKVVNDDLRAVLFDVLHAKDDEGNSVFHLCAMFNLSDAMQVLIAFLEAEFHARDAEKGSNQMSTLLEKGNRVGFRALHIAVKFRSIDVARLLVEDLEADVNCLTSLKQTPLHVAATVGATDCARLLRQAKSVILTIVDSSGSTPLDIARRAHFQNICVLLEQETRVEANGLSGSKAATTRFLFHQDSLRHLPMAFHRRGGSEPPPENPERIDTLVDEVVGILRSREFLDDHVVWDYDVKPADIADILRVHEYNYVRKIREHCGELSRSVIASRSTTRIEDTDADGDDPEEIGRVLELDPDTALSLRSFDAAVRAAGAVCRAVDLVVRGECTNAFCIVRPPGHHAGPTGKVTCCNDPDGSHGFCVFNNVAIGAAYARSHFKHEGIHRIAILDFDVHHGNGTEEIIRQLVPSVTELRYETPYGEGKQLVHQYKPWRNEEDAENVFFCSVHGYGHKDPKGELSPDVQQAWFYPGSGETVEKESPLIMNVGMGFCPEGSSVSRLRWRSAFRDRVLPKLMEFKPDLIFLSAGFDAHKKEHVNWGYVALLEQDYEWLVHHVKRVANTCCKGRVISVLEGGYNFHGRMASPFARSVAAHARALVCPSREAWDENLVALEAEHERAILEGYLNPSNSSASSDGKSKKRASLSETQVAVNAEEDNSMEFDTRALPVRSKRARKQVDYVALAAELAKEVN